MLVWKQHFFSSKRPLTNQGFNVGAHDRLTNAGYADDRLLYANFPPELSYIIETLREELDKVGLQMHGKKTKNNRNMR